MTVAATSIEAYREHEFAGKIGKQSVKILEHMLVDTDYSRREISRATNIDLSAVCGRVNEMLAIGILFEGKTRKCKITCKTICPVSRVTYWSKT